MFQNQPSGTHSKITGLSVVKPITVPDGAQGVWIQVISQNVRMTFDNTNPSSADGWEIKAGDAPLFYAFPAGTVLKFIEETASAEIQWQAGGQTQVGAPLRTG